MASLCIEMEQPEAEKYFSCFRLECEKSMKIANLYDPDSELCRLNRSASTAPFKCSESLYNLLKKCRKAWIHSEGAFDISAKKLMDIWGFYRKRQNKMPAPQEIRNVLQKTGLEKVIFDNNERTVFSQ